jgi:hypothetical protein
MLLNGTVENVLANKAELAVNSSESTLNVGPAFSGIMGELSVMVLEVSDSDEPVVDPEVGNEVEVENSRNANLLGSKV